MRSKAKEIGVKEAVQMSDHSVDPAWEPKSYFKANLWGALTALGFGIAILLATHNYALLVDNLPGPGMYPLLIGLSMTALSVIWILGTLRGRHAPDAETGSPGDRDAMLRALLTIFALLAFALVMSPLGYPISASLLVFSLILLARGRLRKAAIIGPIFGIASYLLITSALGVPLSSGILSSLIG
jgi:hypothetical protein